MANGVDLKAPAPSSGDLYMVRATATSLLATGDVIQHLPHKSAPTGGSAVRIPLFLGTPELFSSTFSQVIFLWVCMVCRVNSDHATDRGFEPVSAYNCQRAIRHMEWYTGDRTHGHTEETTRTVSIVEDVHGRRHCPRRESVGAEL